MWKIRYSVVTIFCYNSPNLANQFVFYVVWITETVVKGGQIVKQILNDVVINIKLNGIIRITHPIGIIQTQLAMSSSLF